MSGPICLHARAEEVDSSYHRALGDKVVFAWLCPDCDAQLPADFVPPRPGAQAPPRTPPPAPVRAPAYRPPRRRRSLAPVLLPVLAVAFIAGVVALVKLNPPGPEAYSASDAAVCRAWFTQGVHAPVGNGVTYIGDYTDPGYAKFTAAENALDYAMTAGTDPYLYEAVQQWEADMESSYVLMHGDWGFVNIGSDKSTVTGWCKGNGYSRK